MTDPVEAREELAKVSSLVVTARRLLAGGKLVDLSAIEERVRSICGAVEIMPRAEGRLLVDDLQALIHKLNQLEADIRVQLEPFAVTPDDGDGG